MDKLIDSEKEKTISQTSDELTPLLIRSVLVTIAILFVFIGVTAIGILALAGNYANKFSQASGLSISDSYQLVKLSLSGNPAQEQGRQNILVLGTDSLSMRGDIPSLTDTMILVSIDFKTGKVFTLPLPRDIYSTEYQTRINALYAYGLDRYPEQPENFPQEVVSEMTGLPIHYTVVVSLDKFGEIIDLLGGVEIDIKQGFVDTQFPKSDVDIHTETDPDKLYETVEFKTGKEIMMGHRALKYIRSRYSESEEGTDLSRSSRQQQVISSIIVKLMSKELLLNPQKMGRLTSLYQTSFASYLPIEDLGTTLKALLPNRNKIILVPTSLSVYPDDPNGVLENPPRWRYDGQWVYEVRDTETFQNEIIRKLEIN